MSQLLQHRSNAVGVLRASFNCFTVPAGEHHGAGEQSKPHAAHSGEIRVGRGPVDEVLVYDAPWMKATAARAGPGPDLGMIAGLAARRFDAAAIVTVYSQSPLSAALLCFRPASPGDWPIATRTLSAPDRLDRRPRAGRRHPPRGAPPARSGGCGRLRRGGRASGPRHPAGRRGACGGAVRPPRPRRSRPVGCRAPRRHRTLPAVPGRAVRRGGAWPRDRRGGRGAHGRGRRAAAVLARARVLVSNNTGPVHLAAATTACAAGWSARRGRPPACPPVAHRVLFHDVPCKYCYRSVCPEGHHDCLRRVAPAAVVAATLELLAVAV